MLVTNSTSLLGKRFFVPLGDLTFGERVSRNREILQGIPHHSTKRHFYSFDSRGVITAVGGEALNSALENGERMLLVKRSGKDKALYAYGIGLGQLPEAIEEAVTSINIGLLR